VTTLTAIQHTLLRSVALGLTRETIAHQRGRSVKTIKGELTDLYRKLGASNAPHAVYIAMRRGLL